MESSAAIERPSNMWDDAARPSTTWGAAWKLIDLCSREPHIAVESDLSAPIKLRAPTDRYGHWRRGRAAEYDCAHGNLFALSRPEGNLLAQR